MERLSLITSGANREDALAEARTTAARYFGVPEDDERLTYEVEFAEPSMVGGDVFGKHQAHTFRVSTFWTLGVDTWLGFFSGR